jgi:PmbA protein
MQASVETIARDADVATGSEFYIGRSYQRSLEDVGLAAAEMAHASLGGVKAESGTFDVLLRPMAVAELLEHTLFPALSSDSVQKGRSTLAGRLEETIANESLVIVDDGLLAGGIDTSAFDGEGVPSQRTVLIDRGILKGFLYDCYTAGKEGKRSTGNAVRSGYTDVPRVGIRNLMVSSTDTKNLLGETKGYLVSGLIGAHTANAISGDFSVEARNAFLIAPGEAAKPIRSLMLAGNIFEVIKDIEVGKDVRAVGSIVTPTVKVKMKVVGS